MAAALQKALTISLDELDKRYDYVKELNNELRDSLSVYDIVKINTPKEGSPFILNISIKGINTNKLQGELDKENIYVATKSACCAPNTVSRPVYAITKDKKLALSTLRISLSHLTTREEIKEFMDKLDRCLTSMK